MSSKDKRNLLAYYFDAAGKEMLPRDPIGNFKADFGKNSIPRAGIDSVSSSFYVKNVHHFPMELVPRTSDPDLTITEYPEFLEPEQIEKITLTFKPSADRINPLVGGVWDFDKIVYAKM